MGDHEHALGVGRLGSASSTSSEAKDKARVMVQHYIAAQQMNTSLQMQIVELEGQLQRSTSGRDEELAAMARKLEAAEQLQRETAATPAASAAVADLLVQQKLELEGRLQAAEEENEQLKRGASLSSATTHTSVDMQRRVYQLEEENARLKRLALDVEDAKALRTQNDALKAKLREKKEKIAQLESVLQLHLSMGRDRPAGPVNP